jgi:hypothetical protein
MLETSSRVSDDAATLQTRAVSSDDWLLPKVETEQLRMGETTSCGLDSRSSSRYSTTMPIDGRKVSEPIRRDKLVVRFPRDRVKLLQQWECVILSVHDDCVECEMHDLTDDTQPVEWAEVFLDQFNHYDRTLLREGAVFYWSIGHETKKTGQVRRYSDIRVRRMPPLSALTRREIKLRAGKLIELIANNS